MFEGLFTGTPTKTATKKSGIFSGLFSNKSVAPVAPIVAPKTPIVQTKTIPSGGQYLKMADDSLTTTPRAYGTMLPKAGYERDHKIPVSLGGTSADANMEYLKSDKTLLNKIFNQPASAKNRQEGKMLVEWKAIDDYKAGRISLNEARVRVLNWDDQPEETYKIYAKELLKSPGNLVKQIGSDAKSVFNGLFRKKPAMVFKIGEGMTEQQKAEAENILRGQEYFALQEQPPVEAKLPFLPVTIKAEPGDQAGRFLQEQIKGLVEWPERAAKTIYQSFGGGKKEIGKESVKPKVETSIDFLDKAKNDPYFSAHPFQAYSLAAFSGALDILPVGQSISSFIKNKLSTLPTAIRTIEEAKIGMGFSPSETITAENLKKSYRQTANVVHPDKGGAPGAFQKLNNYNQTLTDELARQKGVINPISNFDQKYRVVLETLDTEVGNLFRTKEGTPYVGVKGLLPEQAGTVPAKPFQPYRQPNVGLSIREVPATPVGGQKPLFEGLFKPTTASQEATTVAQGTKTIQTPATSLIEEAKSSEEFVKAQGDTISKFKNTLSNSEPIIKEVKLAEGLPERKMTLKYGGKVGDYITNPKLRETIKDSLDTPIYTYSGNAGLQDNLEASYNGIFSPQAFFDKNYNLTDAILINEKQASSFKDLKTIYHEAIHAQRYKIDKTFDFSSTYEKRTFEQSAKRAEDFYIKNVLTNKAVEEKPVAVAPKTKSIKKEVITPAETKQIISAKDYALAKKTRQTLLREAVLGEPGALAQNKIELAQEKRAQINNSVIEGIKNSPYFRKEGAIQDAMGEGYLMEKGGGEAIIPGKGKVEVRGRFVIVGGKDIAKYRQLGYKERVGIDSLAMEAGFEDIHGGEDYLNSQLEASRAMRTTDVRTVTEKELLKDKEFSNISAEIQATEDALAEETVPAKRLLLEQGKRELDQRLFNDRKYKICAVQEYFGLSDQQMKKINYRDLRTMGVNEYNEYFAKIQAEAFKESENVQAKNELQDLIKSRELKKVENLQKAMKLPPVEQMTTEELRQFANALEPYQQGDEFLSTRKLETIDRTSFAGVKTWREAIDKVEKNLGLKPGAGVKADQTDRFRWDTALAERDPFYKYVVKKIISAKTDADSRLAQFEHKVDNLFRGSRKGTGFLNKVIPQDKKIIEYLESENKLEVAETMTPAEIETATYLQQELQNDYNYLIQTNALKHSRFENVYYPHIQRSFFEAVKDDGLKTGIREALNQQKLDEKTLAILDEKTGTILPFEKWLRFVMERTGGVTPTQNAAKAFMIYKKALEQKKALDSIIPEIMTAVDVISPRAETPTGLKTNESLKNFITEYINTRKGRPIKLLVKPGDPADAVLQGVKAIIVIHDLALNIPLQLGSQGGVHAALYTLMGPKKYALGVKRLALGIFSKRIKGIVKQYENYTGRTPWNALFDSTRGLPEKAYSLMFALFRDATVRGNKIHLLGSMSDQEWLTGNVSADRLADLKLEAGRWLPVEKSSSIIGATSEGKLATLYHTWAIPIIRTVTKNGSEIIKMIRGGEWQKIGKSREFRELFNALTVTALVALLAYAIGYEKDPKKAKQGDFIDKLINKTIRDSFSLVSALNPNTYLQGIRVISFVEAITAGLTQLVILDKYKTSGQGYEKGDLKGVEKLKRELLPVFLKPSEPKPTKEEEQVAKIKQQRSEATDNFRPTYDKIQNLAKTNPDAALEMVNKLSDPDYEIYKKIKTAERTKQTNEAKKAMYPTVSKIQGLVKAGKQDEAMKIINAMTEEEYRIYGLAIKEME